MPNAHISKVILSPTSYVEESSDDQRTELHYPANMVVLGSHSFVFESTIRTCNDQPFTSDIDIANNVPIVDGALVHDCPYSVAVYVLVIIKALYVPSINHNLLTSFIMRACGIAINDVQQIHCEDPAVNGHIISFEHSDLKITLQLNRVFSYFHTIETTEIELHEVRSCS